MTIEYFSEMFQVDENTLEVDGTTITNKLVFNNINVSVRYFEEIKNVIALILPILEH